MNGPRSLQRRLGVTLGLLLTALWIVAASVTAWQARQALDAMFDSALQETAQRILPLAVADILARDEEGVTRRQAEVRPHDELLTYAVRDAQGRFLTLSHDADPADFPPWQGPGFGQSATHRFYNEDALQGTVRVTVAEPLAHRAAASRDIQWGLGLPLIVLLPVALLGITLALRSNLGPLRRFSDRLALRGARDLSRVPTDDLPAELLPVAQTLNGLLGRLSAAFEAERSFAANAAHELRTPLAGAIAQVQRLQAETADPVARTRGADIEATLKRLTRLAERLLQLARAEGGRLRLDETTDLRTVARIVNDELARAAGAGRIALVLPAEPVLSDLDPDVFAILYRNLVDNALRHGTPDTPVHVSLGPDGRLTVANDGPVVPGAALARLVDRFERSATQAPGSGLGLAIVHAIAQRIGSALVLQSPRAGHPSGFEATVTVPVGSRAGDGPNPHGGSTAPSAPAASAQAGPVDGSSAGLTAAEAARRLAEDGPNALPGGGRRTLLSITLETMREPMFLLLLAAGTLYLVFGDLQEGLTLFGFVLVTLALTLVQEGRTERAIEALRDLTSPRALVIRDGRPTRIAGREVVRGDLLKLSEGDRVPADALLVEADGVRADESLLTGESVPVGKRPASAAERDSIVEGGSVVERDRGTPGGDDQPRVYAGTSIVQGHALARVTATGPRSEIGRIGAALGTVEQERSPLQRQTTRLVRNLALLALALSLALVVFQGLLKGDWLQALLAGIALAMAMLPEEYPVVLTVFPALGARRLSKEGVLTRRITAIETLGATTVLCSDKTGTLTENRMTVTHLVAGGVAVDQRLVVPTGAGGGLPEPFHALVEVAILASVVDPFDPMEKAFHDLGQRFLADTEHLHRDWRLVRTYALSPALRAMSHVWVCDTDGVQTVAAKGAPEAVIDLCHLGEADRVRISAAVDELAASGLRVLGVARGRFEGQAWPAEEHGLEVEFVGLLGLADPVRTEVPAAVAQCRAAGIRVVMITGDYPATARTIAQQAGLAEGGIDVLSGDEIASLGDQALRERLAAVNVCARIAPDQKLRIVQALKARGEVVAMTGDGVNDAPALRAAHVGVAMGRRGTDVARESSSLVLVDDDFASIVRAIRLGRRIFDNLRKAMSYILAVHVPIAGMALLPVLLGWPPLLFPMHIALLELIIDPACSLAFENEPAEPDVMQRPPRDADAPLFGGATLGLALLQGAGVLAVVLLAYAWAGPRMPEAEARAFAFATLVSGNLALILSNRSGTASLWTTLRTPNAILWWVVGGALVLLGASLYLPWAVELLRFALLPARELGAAVGLGLASVLWFEVVKLVRSRRAAARRLTWPS